MRTTPRPPLSKRLKPAHWTVIDYAAGVMFGLSVFAMIRADLIGASYQVPFQVVRLGPSQLVTFGVAAGVTLSVATRRRHPMTSLCLLLGGSILVAVLTGGTSAGLDLFAPASYVIYLIVATFDDRRRVSQALIAALLVLLANAAIMAPRNGQLIPSGSDLIPVFFAVGIAWSIGYIVRQRRRYAIGMQEEAASKAVAVERLRIARELHDVVAHSMSVIAVQAGYGQYVIDSQPDDAREALGAIQATSREALEEMRRMLGALRQADEAGPLAPEPAGSGGLAGLFGPGERPAGPQDGPAPAPLLPAPALTDLDRLLMRTASAGVHAEVHRVGEPRELPGGIELSAYRIIQEALTNVVKHAHASRCSVLLDYGEQDLTIEVTDSGTGVPAMALAMSGGPPSASLPSGGHGIIGMRERVSMLGGQFTAGPLPGYGFQVSARIPLPSLDIS
ncbi:MAG TPA: sensor histidine kinase [Streptosporangiaceae bacterium]